MPSGTRIWSQSLSRCPRYTVREDSACEYTKPFGNALQHIEPHCQKNVVNHDRDEEDDSAPKNEKPQANNNEDSYVGERNDSRQRYGRGIRKYDNGCRHDGCFVNDKRQGFGKVWYPLHTGVTIRGTDRVVLALPTATSTRDSGHY